MRFELFLEKLPRASNERVEAAMAELPQGLSKGVLTRAITERVIPTVSFAFSEDKRVINEVFDTLVELGAQCRLKDHGHVGQKLHTWLQERFGGARYLDEEEPEPIAFVKLWFADDKDTLGTRAAGFMLRYVVQAVLAAALLVWAHGLRIGLSGLIAWPRWLSLQLLACALGLFVGYAGIALLRAYRAKLLPKKPAAALATVLLGVTTSAALFVTWSASSASALHVIRPPSNPYAGLIVELRRRDEAGERPSLEPSAAASQASSSAAQEAASWCLPDHVMDGPACEVDMRWLAAHACLEQPATLITTDAGARDQQPAIDTAHEVAAVAAAPKASRVAEPWSVRLEAVHLAALLALGLGCLLIAQLAFQRSLRKTLREEAKLREEGLAAELAKARESAREASLERAATTELRDELSKAQAALITLREQQSASTTLATAQAAEIMRLNTTLDTAQDELRRLQQSAHRAANDQSKPAHFVETRDTGARAPLSSASSYSVTSSQEERIGPRRRGA